MRPCPALGKRICSPCCGTKRRKEIACPDDCDILRSSMEYQAGKEADARSKGSGIKARNTGKGPAARRTDAWCKAERAYSLILASGQPGTLLDHLGPEERKRDLRSILTACPDYYPAMLDLGFHLLCHAVGKGDEDEGRRLLGEGARRLLASGVKDEIDGTLEPWCSNLESRFRHEESVELYRIMLHSGADPGRAHDGMGYCLAYLGDLEGSARESGLAVKAEPRNASYLSNLAYTEMQRGNLEAARRLLENALRDDPAESYALGNMMHLKLMLRKGGPKDLKSLLLAEPDLQIYHRLEEAEDDARLEGMAREHNANLLQAFRMDLAKRKDLAPGRKYDLMFSIKYFTGLAERLSDDGPFSLSSAIDIRFELRDILDRFVVETRDADRTTLGEMCDAILEFCGFLATEGVFEAEDHDEIVKTLKKERPKVERRMERYNRVRSAPEVTPEAKARARRKIFGTGSDWR